jgi:hypothetical protein
MLLPRLSRRGFKWMDKTFKPRSLRPSLPRQILRALMHRRNRTDR